jgi:hypothetical protein
MTDLLPFWVVIIIAMSFSKQHESRQILKFIGFYIEPDLSTTKHAKVSSKKMSLKVKGSL